MDKFVCVCVCVAGSLPVAIQIRQREGLLSLIFNKAPGEPRTSSSGLSVYDWLLNKAHSVWRAEPGRASSPKEAVTESVNSCELMDSF